MRNICETSFHIKIYVARIGVALIVAQERMRDWKKEMRMKKSDSDAYLDEQLKDPAFAERFEKAGEAWETWDVALQIAALRERAGVSQRELASRVKTSR
jgi:ribosome-binding protein aMBF1 (putative translation factor)